MTSKMDIMTTRKQTAGLNVHRYQEDCPDDKIDFRQDVKEWPDAKIIGRLHKRHIFKFVS